jgi:hypothetical protein
MVEPVTPGGAPAGLPVGGTPSTMCCHWKARLLRALDWRRCMAPNPNMLDGTIASQLEISQMASLQQDFCICYFLIFQDFQIFFWIFRTFFLFPDLGVTKIEH